MRKSSWIIIVVLLLMTIFCTACEEDGNEKVKKKKGNIQLTITVDCESNLLFSRYDVDIYVDEELLGTLDHGNEDTYKTKVTKGKHVVKFESAEDSSVDGKKTIYVDQEMSLNYKVSCKNDQIEIEEIESETTSELEEADIEETQLKETEIKEDDYSLEDDEEGEDALTETYAWSAFEQYGDEEYPYGFKVHWITGLKASEKDKDGKWFVKVNVTIENEYGNKMKTVAEGRIGGTNDEPIVEHFYVY